MKKVLSVFLAVLMMFSVMAIGASADDETEMWSYQGYPQSTAEAIIVLDINGGTYRDALKVYNLQTGQLELRELSAAEMKEKYVWTTLGDGSFEPERPVSLPAATAPKGYQFDGWYCVTDHKTYGAVPNGYEIPEDGAGTVIEFRAAYSPTAPETDTFAKVFDVLIKVFGAIYGFLTGGDTEKGIATMRKLFAGLMD